MAATTGRKLTLADIADLRAYERERESFRAEVIAVKKRRRVAVGPFVTLLFENRTTIRFQIQEMARSERILTDAAIQHELDVYNPLIPEPGTLAATLFVELTSKRELEDWLPKLVGIERAVELRAGDVVVSGRPDVAHDAQLTREAVTSSVHYVHFVLTPAEIDAVEWGPAELAVTLGAYLHAAKLEKLVIAELLNDLRG